jgi:uncharacterized protein YciW
LEDIINAVAGLSSNSPLNSLRARREDYVRYSQGSYDVLIRPDEPGGFSLAERAAAALRIAEINQDTALAAHYRGLLPVDLPQTPRLTAILAHVELVARTPRAARPAHLHALAQVGFSTREIVVLSQLIAFVSYQTRVLAGLRLLTTEAAA